ARGRRGRRSDPSRRGPVDRRGVPAARRLRDGRCEADRRRAAARSPRHPRGWPRVSRRPARGGRAPGECLSAEPRGGDHPRAPIRRLPLHLDRRLSLPDRRGGGHRARHGGGRRRRTPGRTRARAVRPLLGGGLRGIRAGAGCAARLTRRGRYRLSRLHRHGLPDPAALRRRGDGMGAGVIRVLPLRRSRGTAKEEGIMPRLTVLTVVFSLVLALDGQPALATHSQAGEAGLAVGAAAANLLYLPAKTLVAIGGLGVGALTGLLTGGDIRAAYAVWVPAAGGTFMLTPAHFEGTRPIEFFGSDYAD